jgi:hypothetical protein
MTIKAPTPSRPSAIWYAVYVGLKIRHFRTQEVYEVVNLISFRENGQTKTTVKYCSPKSPDAYQRSLHEFWEEVEAEPGKWVMRFTPADNTPLMREQS